ncbi:MAG: putative selenium-dependent hydroxylase accessory protein YqeC [Candidatus Adiutrix sp.]|jgi:hypothetical protein|nr:putative selenium-dependent hydroxylase accessory protein YqeC [Candidatus Adiutrix sp.]
MKFADLTPGRGSIAIIGGGGKTGLMERLEAEFHESGRPALCTVTTRLGRGQLPHLARAEAQSPAEAANAARRAAAGDRLILSGPYANAEKLSGLPLAWLSPVQAALPENAAFIIEADGSAGRPLKAHAAHEPVLPPQPCPRGAVLRQGHEASQTTWPSSSAFAPQPYYLIAVLGLSALTLPWPKAVHRPEILARHITPPPADQSLSPAQIADFIRRAWASLHPDFIFLNQADLLSNDALPQARDLAARLAAVGYAVALGSLKEQWWAAVNQ